MVATLTVVFTRSGSTPVTVTRALKLTQARGAQPPLAFS
jgi:hypothetical protein